LRRPPARQLATLRFATDWDTLLPLLAGGTVLIFAGCLATMGVKRFYGQPASLARHRADYGIKLRRAGLLHLRLRQHADADPDPTRSGSRCLLR